MKHVDMSFERDRAGVGVCIMMYTRRCIVSLEREKGVFTEVYDDQVKHQR